MLSTVYAPLCLQNYTVDWRIYYTLHIPKDALHCVCADVTSTYSPDWMIFHTYHMNTDAPHYVDAYGSSTY
jgi:hypothetical protein